MVMIFRRESKAVKRTGTPDRGPDQPHAFRVTPEGGGYSVYRERLRDGLVVSSVFCGSWGSEQEAEAVVSLGVVT